MRHFAFGNSLRRSYVTADADDSLNTDVAPSNEEIEALLQGQARRATDLLRIDAAALLQIVRELLAHGHVPSVKMSKLLSLPVQSWPDTHAAEALG